MQFGGWYDNPATGRNQRWWGDYGWTDGADPTQGGASQSSNGDSSGAIPAFNFDYEGEAKKAYGELGTYYGRLLTEAKGDMNKVLSRLVEDYDRGVRIKSRDTGLAVDNVADTQEEADRQAALSRKRIVESALSRGLYQKSLSDPNGGFGIPDQEREEFDDSAKFATEQRTKQKQALTTNLSDFMEEQGIYKTRTTDDTIEAGKRKEFDLDEQRKRESSELANLRGQRAYQDYQNKNLTLA